MRDLSLKLIKTSAKTMIALRLAPLEIHMHTASLQYAI